MVAVVRQPSEGEVVDSLFVLVVKETQGSSLEGVDRLFAAVDIRSSAELEFVVVCIPELAEVELSSV